jgi:hypothetical protein
MKVQHWKGWLFGSLVGLLLVACGRGAPVAQPLTRITDARPPAALGNINIRESMTGRWLAGQTCQRPCWESITPGIATLSEALQLLEENPNVTDVTFDGEQIRWNWSDHRSRDAGTITGSADGLVERIRLDFAPRLGAVIAAFGEPSGVLAYTGTRSEYPGGDTMIAIDAVRIVYAEQGFYFDALAAERPRIDAELMLIGPVLLAATANPADMAPQAAVALVPWQGEQSFDFYYRDIGWGLVRRYK